MGKKISDEAVLAALLSSPSATAAAKLLNVSKQTLTRRLKSPDLREKFEEIRRAAVDEAATRLSQTSAAAADTLIALLNSQNEMTRLTAASRILSISGSFIDRYDVLQRLDRLEEELSDDNRF